MTTHSSILAWRIPWTEEPGGLPFIQLKELDMTEETQHSTTRQIINSHDQDPSLYCSFCILELNTKTHTEYSICTLEKNEHL